MSSVFTYMVFQSTKPMTAPQQKCSAANRPHEKTNTMLNDREPDQELLKTQKTEENLLNVVRMV